MNTLQSVIVQKEQVDLLVSLVLPTVYVFQTDGT